MTIDIETLEFKNISFQFDEHHKIVQDLDFQFPMNSIVRIHGPHGCGKSTLLRMLACLVEPSGGEYLINGQVINQMSFEELIPFRLKIGYGFDYGGLLNNRTIYQNLILPIQYHNIMEPDIAERHVEKVIELFSLQRAARSRPS
ncbi:MAG: ATP-binding cassette domain-containing protein, partial [Bdellovibrionales bacterium]|nr:ATP-binding cassette domain-containing protein [Bdellovibrionales bacterium]